MPSLLSTLSFLLEDYLLLRNEQGESLLSPLDKLIGDNLQLNTQRRKDLLKPEGPREF